MSNLDLTEAAHGGPFRFRVGGETYLLPDPADLPYQAVLAMLQLEHVPHPPKMAEWQRARLFGAWAAHYDLPEFGSAQRLAYLIDHYRSALVYDLQAFSGVDLGALWRERRWRTLLDLIDHLPGHSWYSSAVSSDPEHAAMIAESLAARQDEGERVDTGPALHTWTPEVAIMTQVLDAVRSVQHAIVAVNSEKGKVPEPPKPAPRPHTPLEAAIKRADFERRKTRHDALAKRLLPHKR